LAVYIVTGRMVTAQGNRSKYIVKNDSGNTSYMTSYQIKNLIASGNTFYGVEIKNGRLYTTEKVMLVQSTGTRQPNRYRDYEVYSDKQIIETVKETIKEGYRPRDYVKEIINYCKRTPEYNRNNILILHGIRRTGKTVSIYHSIAILLKMGVKPSEILFITVYNRDTSYREVEDIIVHTNKKYIFVDEITFLENFINYASSLHGHFSAFMRDKRMIIAGTDSFAFPKALQSSLYDRAYVIHTTYIPYKEIKKLGLIVNNQPDWYIKHGGNLVYQEFDGIRQSNDTMRIVIIKNIIDTINRNNQYFDYDSRYNELKSMTYNEMQYLILYSISRIVRPENSNSIKYTKAPTDRVKQLLTKIGDTTFDLEDFRVLKDSQVRIMDASLAELDILKIVGNLVDEYNENEGIQKDTRNECICTIQALAYSVLNVILGKHISDLNGNTLENLVLSECYMHYQLNWQSGIEVGYAKYTYNNKKHEIDCVVSKQFDNGEYHFILIEVKYSDKPRQDFKEHITDDSVELALEGIVDKRYIVYRGKTQKQDNIKYINIYDFLENLDKYLY
jgi:hypothetical protein